MELVVLAKGDKKGERFNLAGHSATFLPHDKSFAVVVPIFDQWTNTVQYSFESDIPQVHFGYDVTLAFRDGDDSSRFVEWLRKALADARTGYDTMR